MRPFIIGLFVLLSFSSNVFAQTPVQGGSNSGPPPVQGGTNGGGMGLTNPLSSPDLPSFLNTILGYLVQIGAVVVTIMVVYVGFLFVTARGEPGKLETAKHALLWTLVGALVLLGAQAISSAIQATAQSFSSSGASSSVPIGASTGSPNGSGTIGPPGP